MMNKTDNTDERLLDMTHQALVAWKAAEIRTLDPCAPSMLRLRCLMRAKVLKCVYLEMLREARTRELSLSAKQLLARILYPFCSEFDA